MMPDNSLIRVENLSKNFNVKGADGKKSVLNAVSDVSFEIEKGKTMGLVGESGSGKTTVGRTLLRLIEPSSGRIFYDGKDITSGSMKPYRKKLQIIFQNPSGSLDHKWRVHEIIAEGLRANKLTSSRAEEKEIVEQLLVDVGLSKEDALRYPGEFSGGQQQRIGIARALAVQPSFIVCDEPISSLDVSYQSQIVNMLIDLQNRRDLTYLFISHDLSIVSHISDTVGVMYLGKLLEYGSCEEIILHAVHPYTKALLNAIPIPDPRAAKARVRQKYVADAGTQRGKCPFLPRCPFAKPICEETVPAMKKIGSDHYCACHLA